MTPAPNAEPPPGSGQNTGISGTKHGVVHNSGNNGSPVPGLPGARRRQRPIRYAHAEAPEPGEAQFPEVPPTATQPTAVQPGAEQPGATQPTATQPTAVRPDPTRATRVQPAATQPTRVQPAPARATAVRPTVTQRTMVRPDVPPPDRAPAGTVLSGTVLPRRRPAGRPVGPANGTASPDHQPARSGAPASPAGPPGPPEPDGPGEPPRPGPESEPDERAESSEDTGSALNEGLGIFGGVKTTEVTDDAPDRGRDRPFRQRPHGDPPEPARVIPIGAAWNQPVTRQPAASEAPGNGKPRPFGMLRGMLYGSEVAEDGHPRVTMRDLPPDIQVRFWRLRAIIMVVVGGVFAALTRNWEVALTLAILAGIVDTVYRSRNAAHYVVTGPHPGARKATRSQLPRLRREGYLTLNDRPIPGTAEIIDHLVVGPSGVYAIDSEKWDAKLPVRTQNGKLLFLGPESQKDRLDHATWEAQQASNILSAALGTQIPVRAALAIYGPKIPWEVITIRTVDVFNGPALRRYLKRRGKAKDGVIRLTGEEIRTIYDTADRVLPEVNAPASTATTVG